ncbi:MAG TPA: hypothetical protein VGG34_07110 [Opitutaceae bacterium]
MPEDAAQTKDPGQAGLLPGRIGAGVVLLSFAATSAWLMAFIASHAVDMMYEDQWDLYQPMFRGEGWWATYDLQHGPHREGIGLVLTRLLAATSGWDSRWDAYAAGLLVVAACGAALLLGRRFAARRRLLVLAAVPPLVMSAHQYEAFLGPVNLSYGPIPLLLLMALCLAWFAASDLQRYLWAGALTFLLVFSGFGLFAGLLTPVLAAVDCVRAARAGNRRRAAAAAAAIALTAAAWALFAHGYVFEPAASGFRFPYERPSQYFVFVAKMFGNLSGTPALSPASLGIGGVAALAAAAVCGWNGAVCLRRGAADNPRNAVLFTLSGFALLFAFDCAVGRVFMSEIAPLAPRYATLVIPGALGILLQMESLASAPRWAVASASFAVLLVPASLHFRADERIGVRWFTDGRRAWKAAYLKSGNEAQADADSHFQVYPGPLGDRLQYLKDHRLNLFHGPGEP